MKRFWLGLVGLMVVALLSSCSGTRMIMQTAPSTPKGQLARPAIYASVVTTWEASKSQVKQSFEVEIYGQYPDNLALNAVSGRRVEGEYFGGKGYITVEALEIANPANDQVKTFNLIVVSPVKTTPTRPIIIMQSFCPANDVVPQADMRPPVDITFSCDGSGIMNSVFGYFFGRYIRTPPIEMILDHGYAFAVMYPPEFIPDSASGGLASLSQYFSDQEPQSRSRAIAAWAKQFSLVARYLEAKPEFNSAIAYGHSRYGKTALLAAAFDEDIDAVIAHQSGTGGASLSRGKKGETVSQITEGYPHWFTSAYSEDSLTVDQHHLLALIAPRPIMLGNAKRDVWSDPNGAFRAAEGADPIYELYGKAGLNQTRLTDFNPEADIAFWMRPGTHGVVKEDWPAFLAFLDSHFK